MLSPMIFLLHNLYTHTSLVTICSFTYLLNLSKIHTQDAGTKSSKDTNGNFILCVCNGITGSRTRHRHHDRRAPLRSQLQGGREDAPETQK